MEKGSTLSFQMKLKKLALLTDLNSKDLPIQLECFYVIREFPKGFRNSL